MMMMMGRRCEECGNQAKKECEYMRCRTCCKTKGFHCLTHIKSTWVPAYRRSHIHQPQPQWRPLSTTNPKRLREQHPSSSSGVPRHFPAELSTTADFRCIKVSSIHDGEERYAYQTTVNIGGHVFKGILHDEGPEKMIVDHQSTYGRTHQELLPSSSSCPFTDFMSATQFSSHQKS